MSGNPLRAISPWSGNMCLTDQFTKKEAARKILGEQESTIQSNPHPISLQMVVTIKDLATDQSPVFQEISVIKEAEIAN